MYIYCFYKRLASLSPDQVWKHTAVRDRATALHFKVQLAPKMSLVCFADQIKLKILQCL